MNVAIIGCGFIGQKRAIHLSEDDKIIAVCDTDISRTLKMSANFGCRGFKEWEKAIAEPEVEAVIIATTHNLLAKIALGAVRAGKHVLIEKPGATNSKDLEVVAEEAKAKGVTVKVGFNHRFHPSMIKAQEILSQSPAGPIMFIRGRYGHGGRVGYDKEWRAKKEIAGGGELIDQGMHLIDLSRMFMGEFTGVQGHLPTYFWDMEVEDNAFMTLTQDDGRAAWLHATWTEWKNMFSLEIYAKYAKIQIDGLGGSYGEEKLTYYRMKPEMGKPDVLEFNFPEEDKSWELEWKNFKKSIENKERPNGDIIDCIEALKITDKLYGKDK